MYKGMYVCMYVYYIILCINVMQCNDGTVAGATEHAECVLTLQGATYK